MTAAPRKRRSRRILLTNGSLASNLCSIDLSNRSMRQCKRNFLRKGNVDQMIESRTSKYKWLVAIVVALIGSLVLPGILTGLPNLTPLFAELEETCSGICADGFYIAPNNAKIYTGARAKIELARPGVSDAGNSSMRLGVKHTSLADQNSDWGAELGWVIGAPFQDTRRHVLASWSDWNTPAFGGWNEIGFLEDTDINTYDYRIIEQKANPSIYKWKFNGKIRHTLELTFQKTTTIVCGGNTSSVFNAIGIAACLDVKYSKPDWSAWILLPSHRKRVEPGYRVANINASSWQSSGNNDQ